MNPASGDRDEAVLAIQEKIGGTDVALSVAKGGQNGPVEEESFFAASPGAG